MAYEGEEMTASPANLFDFNRTYAVIVTGSWFNKYGHMLLNTGGKDGIFFQVAGLRSQPRFMNATQFQRYLTENEKSIVSVISKKIPRPIDAQNKLIQILSEPWTWGAIANNCETMVEEIIMAGGGTKVRTGILPLPMDATNICSDW